MTWSEVTCDTELRELISRLGCGYLIKGAAVPTAKDQTVAWKVYVELRTRITTQELHFLDGDEQTAVESLFKMFQPCRELLAEVAHGPPGNGHCRSHAESAGPAIYGEMASPDTGRQPHARRRVSRIAG